MASVAPDREQPHGDPRDDESILDDDLIEADDGKPKIHARTYLCNAANTSIRQLLKLMTPCTIPPTQPPYEATSKAHRRPEATTSLAAI